jgi:hypothetical protein
MRELMIAVPPIPVPYNVTGPDPGGIGTVMLCPALTINPLVLVVPAEDVPTLTAAPDPKALKTSVQGPGGTSTIFVTVGDADRNT